MKILIDKRILEIEQKQALYTGNINSYVVDIEFVNDIYDDYLVYIVFKNCNIKKKVLVQCNKVIIPSEVLKEPGDLIVGFFAVKNDNEKVIIYSSNIEMVSITNGGYDEEATYTEELTPSILEQYLQEMKKFYNESIKEYKDNAIAETNKFNTNADTRKQEIDAVAKEVIKNKEDIEEIKLSVEASEQNAKASETNAKASEQNAQKSAENASEILRNVTGIQANINETKGQIDTIKSEVDTKAGQVVDAVEEATNQANISKEQADISIEKAGQVSADKNAVESMMNEVSSMKTSVEQTKADAEQIKTDTQGVYDNTVAIKEETLEAKTEVENSLENERIESDKKYAKTLKDSVTDKNFAQIYADNSKIDNLVIKGSQLKQETHTSTANILYSEEKYWEIGSLESTTGQPMENNTRLRTKEFIPLEEQEDYFASTENSNYVWLNIHYYNSKKEFITTQQTITDNVNGNTNVSILPPQGTKYLKAIIRKTDNGEMNLPDVSIAKTMIVKGTSKIDYIEGYPIMPSLDYPSETDLTTEQNIQDSQENILYIDNSDYKPGYTITSAGITFTVQDDLGLKCVGTATSSTKVNILGIYANRFEEKLNIPKGQKIYGYITGEKVTGARIVLFSNNKYTVLTSTNSYIFQESTPIGQVYAEVVTNSIVDCVVYPQITYEKVDKFYPYIGYRKNISLPPNEFNNGIGEYSDKIYAAGKQDKVIQRLVLDGTENISTSSNGNIFRFRPEIEPIVNNTSGLKTNAIMSNAFSNMSFDNLYNANVENGIEIYNGLIQFRDSTINSVDDCKTKFKELYDAGTPVIIYYVTNAVSVDLPEGTVPKIELMDGLNNISIDKGTMSFEYNKSLARAFEEEKENNANLQSQIDEIKALLSATSTASLLAENLAKDNESEVI